MAGISRRGFFGAMAGAAMGGRKIAQDAAMQLAGIGRGFPPAPPMSLGGWATQAPSSAPPRVLTRAAMRLMGVPDWLRKEWAEQAKGRARVALDPDLAECRFMSLSVKVIHQQMRNEKAVEEEFWNRSSWRQRRQWLEDQGYDDFE